MLSESSLANRTRRKESCFDRVLPFKWFARVKYSDTFEYRLEDPNWQANLYIYGGIETLQWLFTRVMFKTASSRDLAVLTEVFKRCLYSFEEM